MPDFTADDLHPTTVYDRDGNRVGKVQQVYLDDDSGRPSWVTVNTGLFGTNESLIPLDGAEINDDVLTVPFDKQIIKDAPNFDPGHHLDEVDERALYDYYGVGGQAQDQRTPAAGGGIGGLAAAAAAGQGTEDDRETERDPDDSERELLERERDLLKRERELLDKDRQLLERERQQGGRPRLRRHQPGQS